jgi:hypothetical protein
MKDLEIVLKDRVGALADVGELLGLSGISIEGGGAWVQGDKGIMHFLVEDAEKAKKILEGNGFVVTVNNVLVQRLRQDVPGQLGKIARLMQKADVNIKVLYSDHYNQLVLVVDDMKKGREIAVNWTKGLHQ